MQDLKPKMITPSQSTYPSVFLSVKSLHAGVSSKILTPRLEATAILMSDNATSTILPRPVSKLAKCTPKIDGENFLITC